MGVIVAPVVEGKLDAWKAWTQELMGPRKAALADFNKRYGLTRHAAWLAAGRYPDGHGCGSPP
jgi:hypothetical protein